MSNGFPCSNRAEAPDSIEGSHHPPDPAETIAVVGRERFWRRISALFAHGFLSKRNGRNTACPGTEAHSRIRGVAVEREIGTRRKSDNLSRKTVRAPVTAAPKRVSPFAGAEAPDSIQNPIAPGNSHGKGFSMFPPGLKPRTTFIGARKLKPARGDAAGKPPFPLPPRDIFPQL
jgi:hypothetical protein